MGASEWEAWPRTFREGDGKESCSLRPKELASSFLFFSSWGIWDFKINRPITQWGITLSPNPVNCSWGSFESDKIDSPMQQLCRSHFSWSVLWLDLCLWFFSFSYLFFSCWLYLQSFSKIGGYFTFVFLLKGFSLVWACHLCTSPILWLVPLPYSL